MNFVSTLNCVSPYAYILLIAIVGQSSALYADQVAFQADLEQIIVTARKREENPQSIPGQLTVFTSNNLEQARISSMEELFFLTPSLNHVVTSNAVEAPLMLRGVGNLALGEPSVGFFVDGIYMGTDSYNTQELFDIERIEVLHGPQPTLYGKSTTGGLINIITKSPTDKLQGQLNASLEDGPKYRIGGAISGAIFPDRLLARLSFSYENFDGYFNNSVDGAAIDDNAELGVRGSFQISASEDLIITPSFSIRDQNQRGFTFRRVADERDYAGEPFNRNDTNDVILQTQGAALKVEYDIGEFSFTSISAFNNNDENYGVDLDYSAIPIAFGTIDNETVDISQEFRLASPTAKPLSWILGSYFFRQKNDYSQAIFAGGAGGFPLFIVESLDHSTTYSLFGQIDYWLSNVLVISGGLRLDHDKRKQNTAGLEQKKHFTNLSTKISISYHLRNNFMLYGSYSLAYRPGAYNEGNLPEFDEEKTNAFEIGFKSEPNNKVIFNGAVFYTLIKDQQVFALDPLTLALFTTNKGEGEIYGAETSLFIKPAQNLEISFSATVLEAEFKKFNVFGVGPNGPGTFDLSGNKLQFVPEYEMVLVIEYETNSGILLDSNFSGRLRLESRFAGKQQWDDFNSASERPIQVFNASYAIEKNGWQMIIFADNILDEKYFSNYVADFRFPIAGSSLGVRGKERHYGLSVRYMF